MFHDKTLVVVGDSFVYGHLGDDINYESCWQRSWVKKLEHIGNFKNSINLGEPGGSNARSHRVIMDFIRNDYTANEQYVIIYATTDLSRFEFSISIENSLAYNIPLYYQNPLERHDEFQVYGVGSWTPDIIKNQANSEKSRPVLNYIEAYYNILFDENYERNKVVNQLIGLDHLFKNLNIQHYFMETVGFGTIDAAKNAVENLPTIEFDFIGNKMIMSDWLQKYKFKPYPCSHFDHDANEFAAKYIYKQIIKDSHGI